MIVFQNPGLIPIEAITTMGVSVKGEGAIGFFGTGVKFAIATVLRLGGTVTIFRGLEAFMFDSRELLVTGASGQEETFQQVCMNGQPLGFTTQLGRSWLPWMAWREFASNCRDEGGRYWKFCEDHQMAASALAIDGHTTVLVHCPEMDGVHAERRTIMLESEPLFSNDYIEIHPGGPSKYVYYRGVRIAHPAVPTKLVYNIKRPLELTEDRTALWDFQWQWAIRDGIMECDDINIVRDVLNCGEYHVEHGLSFVSTSDPSPAFVEVGAQLAMGAEATPNANPSVVRNARDQQLRAMKPGDGMKLNDVQQAMLNRATSMLIEAGFAIDDFPLVVADTLGAEIHGLAKDGKIYVSALAFNKGTRELAATLLEEYAHLKSGQNDCTRGFQNWLFDQLLIKVEASAGVAF